MYSIASPTVLIFSAFSSGISTGTIVALVLNLVLKETQVSAEKLQKVEVA